MQSQSNTILPNIPRYPTGELVTKPLCTFLFFWPPPGKNNTGTHFESGDVRKNALASKHFSAQFRWIFVRANGHTIHTVEYFPHQFVHIEGFLQV